PGKAKFVVMTNGAWNKDCKEEIPLINVQKQVTPCLLSCNTIEMDSGTALSLILTDLTILKETENQLKEKNEQLKNAQLATEKLNNELEETVKQRTNELFLSREHFKYLANNIPQMSWTNLPDGEVNFYNQQWINYTGLTLEESKNNGW